MNLQDMTDIITAYDGVREVEKGVELLSGKSKNGAIDKLSSLWNVIERNSVLYQTKGKDEDFTLKFYLIWCTVNDSSLDAEFRAKIILNLL